MIWTDLFIKNIILESVDLVELEKFHDTTL